MRKPYIGTALGIVLLLSFVSLLVGCGSGSHDVTPATGSKSASLIITIKWPKTTRLIPLATSKIKVDITNKAVAAPGNIVTTTIIPQGQTTTTIPALPAGNLTMTASALDANGAVIARGPKDVTTQVNVVAQVTINMDSTVAQITVTPANPTVSVMGTVQLTAGATNTDQEMVLLAPSKLTWQPVTAADATFATVDAHSGIVTGVKQGIANIRVTDTESNKSATVSVTIASSTMVAAKTVFYTFFAGTLKVTNPSTNQTMTYQPNLNLTPVGSFAPGAYPFEWTVTGAGLTIHFYVDDPTSPTGVDEIGTATTSLSDGLQTIDGTFTVR